MAEQLTEIPDGDWLARNLAGTPLISVESDTSKSVYRYQCGCVGIRTLHPHKCAVQRCSQHRADDDCPSLIPD